MKKIILTMAFAGISASMYAYSGSDDEGFATFLAIVQIVMGVLSLILFFKIWGMTNDVRKLRDNICTNGLKGEQLSKKMLILKYTGKIDEAKRLLDENLGNEVFAQLCTKGNGIGYTKSQVEEIIKKYENYYKSLDCEMPAEIKNINVGKVVGELSSL